MKKRILVIDDDEFVRDSLKKVLDEAGYAVVLAGDGQQGLARLEAELFDLLILDLNLPVVSGWDILDRSRAGFPSLPVLILSGELEHCEPGAFAGADAVLAKPPDVSHLLRTIEFLLNEPTAKRLERLRQALAGPRGVVNCLKRFWKPPGNPSI